MLDGNATHTLKPLPPRVLTHGRATVTVKPPSGAPAPAVQYSPLVGRSWVNLAHYPIEVLDLPWHGSASWVRGCARPVGPGP